jgi:hypothetical protein
MVVLEEKRSRVKGMSECQVASKGSICGLDRNPKVVSVPYLLNEGDGKLDGNSRVFCDRHQDVDEVL